jgi:hypothetical protein
MAGSNTRRVYVNVDVTTGEITSTNLWKIDEVELPRLALTMFVENIIRLHGNFAWSAETAEWLGQHKSRLVIQRYGQDHLLENEAELQSYLTNMYGSINMELVDEIEIALARNLFCYQGELEENQQTELSLLLLTPKIKTLFGRNRLDVYNQYFLDIFACVQAKAVPSGFLDELDLPEGAHITSCQIYSTAKALLRPTVQEEPFRMGNCTRAATQRGKISESQLESLLMFFDLPEKFRYLQHQPTGLRVEYEIKLDAITNPEFRNAETLVQTILDIHHEANPWNDHMRTLFGSNAEDLMVAVPSNILFEYVGKVFGHLTKPIERILTSAHTIGRPPTCDETQIVAVFERLIRMFLTGGTKYMAKDMRLFKFPSSLKLCLPYVDRHDINLETTEVNWTKLRRDANSYYCSYLSVLNNPTDEDFHMRRLQVQNAMRTTRENYNRATNIEELERDLTTYIGHLCQFALRELKTAVQRHFWAKVGGKSADGQNLYRQLIQLEEDDFFSQRTLDGFTAAQNTYHVRGRPFDMGNILDALFFDPDYFAGYEFKNLFLDLVRNQLPDEVPIEDVATQVYEYFAPQSLHWCIVPQRRLTLKNLTIVTRSDTSLEWLRNSVISREHGQRRAASVIEVQDHAVQRQFAPIVTQPAVQLQAAPIVVRPIAQPQVASVLHPQHPAFMPRIDAFPQDRLPHLNSVPSIHDFRELKTSLLEAIKKMNQKIASTQPGVASISPQAVLSQLGQTNECMVLYMICCSQLMLLYRRIGASVGPASTAGAALLHFCIHMIHDRDQSMTSHLSHFKGNTGAAFQNYKVGSNFLHNIKILTQVRNGRLNWPHFQQMSVQDILHVTGQSVDEQKNFFQLDREIQ